MDIWAFIRDKFERTGLIVIILKAVYGLERLAESGAVQRITTEDSPGLED
nr:hypothetical protein [uncultured Acetatifactor sp.]